MPNEARQYQPDQVSTRPLDAPLINPGIASPEAYGAGIGRAVSGAAQDIGSTNKMLAIQAQRDKEKAAHTKSINAYLKAREEEGKARNEAQQTTGLNAEGQVEKYKSKLEEIRQRYAKDLQGDDDAIDTFNQMFDQAKADGSVDLDRHERVQRRAVERDSRNALVVQSRMDGLDGVIDIDTSLDRQVGSIADLAEIEGEHPEETGLKVQDAKDKTIAAHVDQQIESGNYADAQKILDSHGDLMSKPARAQIEGKLKAHSDDQKAQNLSDAMFKSGNFKTKGDIDKAIRLIDDERLRSSVQVKADHEWARMEYAKQEENKAVYEEGTVHVENGRSVQVYLAKYGDKMTSNQRESLLRYSDMIAASEEPESTGPRWVELRNSMVASPKEFMKLNLAEDKANLSKRDYKELVEMQLSMAQGNLTKGSKEDIERGIFSPTEIGLQALSETGVDVSMKDGKFKDPNALEFMIQYSNLVAQGGGTKNKSDKELRSLASGLLVKHRIEDKTGIFTRVTTVPRFKIKGARDISYNTQDMPSETREKIITDLEKIWGPRVDPKTGDTASWLTEEALLSGWANTQAGQLLEAEQKEIRNSNPDNDLLFMGY